MAAKGVLPFCQDTGTAIIHGEKGQQVWTGYCDEEALSLGVYKTYTEENLRYSQNAPLTMYDEVNTKCNLPAQIDLEATEGMEYKFLCVTKGGGSANKTYLYQETKAILNPGTLVPFLVEKMKTWGTAACPPYHIAFVIGGTSAEKNLLTVKLASTHYYDSLPTTGNEFGRAFRDIELEKQVLEEAHRIGLGAQFGGKYLAHDVRIIRLPRHGASCPVGLGVSCSADRNIKCKINKDGIWIEKLDSHPGELIPEELRQAGEGNAVKINLNQPMSEILKELDKYPVATRLSLNGTIIVGRDIAHAKLKERLDRGEYQRSPHLLCRSGKNAERHGLRVDGSHDSRSNGSLRRPLPKSRRFYDYVGKREPQPSCHRRLQETRRILPRQYRRSGRYPRSKQYQEYRMPRISRTRHGSHLENRSGRFSRIHSRRQQRQRFLQTNQAHMPGQEIIGPNYLSIKKELPVGSSFFINSPQ